MIIVSACLAGVNCRHDGCIIENKLIKRLVGARQAIPLCAEVMGGRPVPRTPAEIAGGTGADVLEGKAKIMDKDGMDVTREILDGVKYVAAAAKKMDIKAFILKTKSPTCGFGQVFDGTFSGRLIQGNGALTAALLKEGVKIYTELDCGSMIDELLEKNG